MHGYKNFLYALFALCFCVAFGVGIYAQSTVKLGKIDGERTFYLDSASSQGLQKNKLSLADLGRIRGESVRFTLTQTEERTVQEILQKYDGEILFIEQSVGVTSYYCQTGDWKNVIMLNGMPVNLHIAVSSEQCVVGTPIIFGGF